MERVGLWVEKLQETGNFPGSDYIFFSMILILQDIKSQIKWLKEKQIKQDSTSNLGKRFQWICTRHVVVLSFIVGCK